MFELNYQNIKNEKKFSLIFLIVGLILIVASLSIFFILRANKNSLDKQTNTTYIEENGYYDDEGDYLYSPIYYYRVNGIEYSCKSSGSSSSRPSSTGTVYYSSKNPSKCMTDFSVDMSWFILIGTALGGIAFTIGIFTIRGPIKEKKKMKYLEKNGKLIKGIPFRLEGTNRYFNGYQMQRIIAYYTQSNGLIIELKSSPKCIYDSTRTVIDLLIDPNDTSNYYMDFDIKYSGNVQVEYFENKETNINSNNTNINN
jgi:hypothetical protein